MQEVLSNLMVERIEFRNEQDAGGSYLMCCVLVWVWNPRGGRCLAEPGTGASRTRCLSEPGGGCQS